MTANNTGLTANNPVIQQTKQAMNALRSLQDPKQIQQALAQAAQQNPQLNATMQMCQGRPPQEIFYEQCKRHGVNPDEAARKIFQMLS